MEALHYFIIKTTIPLVDSCHYFLSFPTHLIPFNCLLINFLTQKKKKKLNVLHKKESWAEQQMTMNNATNGQLIGFDEDVFNGEIKWKKKYRKCEWWLVLGRDD